MKGKFYFDELYQIAFGEDAETLYLAAQLWAGYFSADIYNSFELGRKLFKLDQEFTIKILKLIHQGYFTIRLETPASQQVVHSKNPEHFIDPIIIQEVCACFDGFLDNIDLFDYIREGHQPGEIDE